MLAVGLTGGIGSGKTTVGELLVARGAVLIDADAIAREVVVPGGPAYGPLVERFGPGIVGPDGSIDRAALAALAFADDESLAALNAITHPAIGAVMAERRAAQEGTDHIVVQDVPLLTPQHRELLSLDVVVVVDCPVEVAVERLMATRNFTRADALARVSHQSSREERREGADYVIDNAGERDALEAQVDKVWTELEARARNTR
ncbi:MAG TPA: dephospho-CoA kinase [Acidimicrobiales bacterium]|nr:dephospho-CoA kinase [Acidimicrobiales bacterium]